MALATQCPHCFTTFRVAADQLKLRGGIVRCGACQSIFDGNAHLVDLDKPAAAKAAGEVSGPVVSPSVSAAVPEQVGPGAMADVAPVVTAEVTPAAVPAVVPDLAPALPPAAAPYGPRERIEPSFGPPLANALIAEPDMGFDREEVRLPELVLKHAPALPEAVRDEASNAVDAPDETEIEAVVPSADDVAAEADTAHAEVHADAVDDAEVEPHVDVDAGPEPDDLPPESEPDDTTAAVPATASTVEPATTLSAALPLRASAGSDAPLSPPVLGSKTARSKALDARTRRSKLTPTKIETAKLRVPAVDPDEPEFVKRSRRQERSTRTRRIAMGAGAAVLALGLAAQVVTEYRNVLAARYPAAKPVLGAACALLGCRVTLPAQVDNLAIDTGELTTLGPGTYALTTQLRNEGALVQAWPSIELELIDADDKPVLRRVFGPADYLPPGALAAAGFGPRAEQPVKLHFALADLKPAGYHTFVFYP